MAPSGSLGPLTGQPAFTKEDFQAIAKKINDAGEEIGQFSQRLKNETPSARDVESGLENAFKSVEGSPAVQEGEQLIQQGEQAVQECGPACM